MSGSDNTPGTPGRQQNRIGHLFAPCRCRLIRRRLRKLAVECNALEKIAGCFEFVVPSHDAYELGKREVRMFVDLACDPTTVGADLRIYATQQLRALSRELACAADRLEGGAA